MPLLGVEGAYRRGVSALGRRRLDRLREQGLPEELYAPLLFLFTGEISPEDQVVVDEIEAVRRELGAREGDAVTILPSPEPGVRAPGEPRLTSLPHVATVASISRYWGTFLHLCAEAVGARTILELGSCAGISGCYLASATSCRSFITVDGSPQLADLAGRSIRRVAAGSVTVVNALFDEALDRVLPALDGGLDLVFLDGQHERFATRRYVERVVPALTAGGLLVVDDVCWTPDMTRAWEEIGRRPGVRCTVDLGRLGLCVLDRAASRGRRFDLSRFTADWRPGGGGVRSPTLRARRLCGCVHPRATPEA